MLELYHHGSSACAAKVRFALEEKGLAWTGHYVDILAGEQFEPAYLAINPKAVVPVLVDAGRVIPESTVICEYVDEVYRERPIYPADPHARAQVRIWAKAVDEELHPACSAVTYIASHRHTILRNGAASFEDFVAAGATEGSGARARKWQWIQQGFDAPGAAEQARIYYGFLLKMERALETTPWLVGASLTMADIALAPYLFRLESLAMDRLWARQRLPHVADWYARVRARPSFAAAFEQWLPRELAAEMRANGAESWPAFAQLLGVDPG